MGNELLQGFSMRNEISIYSITWISFFVFIISILIYEYARNNKIWKITNMDTSSKWSTIYMVSWSWPRISFMNTRRYSMNELIQYCCKLCIFTENCIKRYESEMVKYPEEYFLFFMEDFFHSADYAKGFIEKILESMEKQWIKKKIIIFSHKTESQEAKSMMKNFENIDFFIHDDIEYFFTHFSLKEKNSNQFQISSIEKNDKYMPL